VAASVLFVYAAMVVSGMTLGVGTSMFAAVAIGLGVDFSIHTLDRLRTLLLVDYKDDDGGAYNEFFQTTGRALLFNFLAIACGFGVLMVSKVSSLNQFGALLVVAVSASFVASLTLLPVLVKTFQPAFILNPGNTEKNHGGGSVASIALAVLALLLLSISPDHARAEEALTAEQIVSNVNAVEDGEFVTRKMQMLMTDRRGQQRSRETISYRKYFGPDKKTVLFFLEPANVKDTAFLIWNYADPAQQDDQWLYLPALRKVRRVSAADRGDYFLGTDFTYEDMKLDGKFEPLDYTFSLMGEESLDGVLTYKIEGKPKDSDTGAELGYSRTVSWIDPGTWLLLKAEFYDLKGQLLKSLLATDIRQVDGFWTKNRLAMQNHQTGHTTEFIFPEVDYVTPVADSLFTQQALARGR
jgi:outer membrane lipoprotein-sorting protein